MTAKVLFEIMTWAEYFMSGGKMPMPGASDPSQDVVKLIARYETEIEKLETSLDDKELHRAALEGECRELSEKFAKVKEANLYLSDRLLNRETELGKVLKERNDLDAKLKVLPQSMQAQIGGRHEVSTDDERPPELPEPVTALSAADEITRYMSKKCGFCGAEPGKPCLFPVAMGMTSTDFHASRLF
jgi:hypothetical protein